MITLTFGTKSQIKLGTRFRTNKFRTNKSRTNIFLTTLGAVALLLSAPTFSSDVAFDHEHQQFNQVLKQIVVESTDKKQTRVDYAKLNQAPQALDAYLNALSKVSQSEYQAWNNDQQLSFLINAYNGFTLKLIDTHFDKFKSGKYDSIKDIGSLFSSPWSKSFFTLLGKERSLDDVEHKMIRQWFERPRIHAALVCAAVSCPPLRNEAFVANQVAEQLDDQMRLFLSDVTRNSVDVEKQTVYLSSIFKWYGKDFEKGHQGFSSLDDVIKLYATDLGQTSAQVEWLTKGKIKLDYLEYDWRLNDVSNF